MSADEIRKLTDLSTPIMPEYWQATVMWTKQWNKIKSALLAYAAMVERCEKIQRHFAMTRTEREMLDYILRGDAGKEERCESHTKA